MASVSAIGGCDGVEIGRDAIRNVISDAISDVISDVIGVGDRHQSAPARETWQGVRDATEQNSRTSVSPIPSTKPAMSP